MAKHHTAALLPGQAQTLNAVAGDTVRVSSGRLWLTQSGSSGDHFLAPGAAFCLTGGTVVIEADSTVPAHFVVCRPAVAPALLRWLLGRAQRLAAALRLLRTRARTARWLLN